MFQPGISVFNKTSVPSNLIPDLGNHLCIFGINYLSKSILYPKYCYIVSYGICNSLFNPSSNPFIAIVV